MESPQTGFSGGFTIETAPSFTAQALRDVDTGEEAGRTSRQYSMEAEPECYNAA
jgi:hypothetical protein